MTADTSTDLTAGVNAGSEVSNSGGLIFICEDSPACEFITAIEADFPMWQFASSPGLCKNPGDVVETASDRSFDRAIFALCREDHSKNEFRSRARRAGINTFGVQFVELPASASELRNKAATVTAIRGSISRAEAFAGSRPENTKTVFSGGGEKISRRALFTIPPIEYRPIPTISRSLCIAGAGCTQCEKACPHDVLKNVGGSVNIDSSACSSCGICVSACPQRAVEFPGFSATEIEDQVNEVLSLTEGAPQNIVFACSKSSELPSDDFQIIPVACTAMVPAAALLSATASGANSVGILRCKEQCRQNASAGVQGRIEYVRKVLELVGDDPERVMFMEPADSGQKQAVPQVSIPSDDRQGSVEIFGRTAAAEAVLKLSSQSTAPLESFVHEHSPIGIPVIDNDFCTMCGTCGAVCPTGALQQTTADDRQVELSLNSAMCIACNECVDSCPEAASGAISLELRTDINALTGGSVILNRNTSINCQNCDKPFTSAATLDRMKELLGDEFSYELYGERCPDCRMIS